MESKNNGTNKPIYKTERVTDVENILMVTEDKGGGVQWETGIDANALRYIKQVTNRACCKHGDPYSVLSKDLRRGRKSKQESMYVELIHFAVQLKLAHTDRPSKRQ